MKEGEKPEVNERMEQQGAERHKFLIDKRRPLRFAETACLVCVTVTLCWHAFQASHSSASSIDLTTLVKVVKRNPRSDFIRPVMPVPIFISYAQNRIDMESRNSQLSFVEGRNCTALIWYFMKFVSAMRGSNATNKWADPAAHSKSGEWPSRL